MLSVNFNEDVSVLSLLTRRELLEFADRLFSEEGSADVLGVDRQMLRAFAEKLASNYHDNPYHNFHHAVDTVNTVAWMITRPVFKANLPPRCRFSLMLAALAHDVDHPGHNNQFEVDTQSTLARQYENTAVLEKHSIQVTREILEDPGHNFMKSLDEETSRFILTSFEELIMSTDFQSHQSFMNDFRNYLTTKPHDFKEPVFLSWITRALIKAADISNTSKPFKEAKMWGRRVMMEFWAQGVEEKKLNLSVGPLNDPDTVRLNAAQAGFIRFAVMDLFQLLGRVDPAFGKLLDNLNSNLKHYEAIVATGESLFE